MSNEQSLTSLFYGVNWCQFYPNEWVLVQF